MTFVAFIQADCMFTFANVMFELTHFGRCSQILTEAVVLLWTTQIGLNWSLWLEHTEKVAGCFHHGILWVICRGWLMFLHVMNSCAVAELDLFGDVGNGFQKSMV